MLGGAGGQRGQHFIAINIGPDGEARRRAQTDQRLRNGEISPRQPRHALSDAAEGEIRGAFKIDRLWRLDLDELKRYPEQRVRYVIKELILTLFRQWDPNNQARPLDDPKSLP